MLPPNLAKKHEQYPKGFPKRINDDLLGHWNTTDGVVVVADHPHGYEVFIYPCLQCDHCTNGDFRECNHRRGPIMTVAGGEIGYRAVLEYLANYGSEQHFQMFLQLLDSDKKKEQKRIDKEQQEERKALEAVAEHAPSVEERILAMQAEIKSLQEKLNTSLRSS